MLMDEARLHLRTIQRAPSGALLICGFLKEELEGAATCRALGRDTSQSIEPWSSAG
jgi:hypothetical protein